MGSYRFCGATCLVLIGSLWGCSGVTPSVHGPSAPFFSPISEDAARLAALTHDLEARSLQCQQAVDCEQIHFAKALVSLFQSREAAETSFHDIIQQHPASRIAVSSRLWLRLLHDQAAGAERIPSSPSIDIVAQYVREWMERQLTEGAKTSSSATMLTQDQAVVHEQPVDQSRVINAMQKQLRERDRQIAVLRSQLEALKFIDQDHVDKQRKVRPPASLRTADHP